MPFWISFTIRTFSWIHILGEEGLINVALLRLGLIDQPLQMHKGRGQHANGEFLIFQQELAQSDTVDLQERAIGNRLGGQRAKTGAQNGDVGRGSHSVGCYFSNRSMPNALSTCFS